MRGRTVTCVVLGALWMSAGCGDDNANGDCTPHETTTCLDGKAYWVNSCGQTEGEKQVCGCGCDADGEDCKPDCNCLPQCTGLCCGDNGCDGVCPDGCASTGQVCNPATCECEGVCIPEDCTQLGKECGSWDDGCGTSLECGGCSEGACSPEGRCTCQAGQTRCVGPSYQECVQGTFSEVQSCGAGQTCSPELGCVECDPAAGNTCYLDNVHACNPDGTIGDLVETCWTEPCQQGVCGDPACPPETMLIYVVDNAHRLLSFNPAGGANEFTVIGNLDCPAGPSWPEWGGGSTATPFSMAVDRSARAWILYTSGEIFWVNTADASCEASPYPKGQDDFKLFGMGFVSDQAGSNDEKLYIAGGNVDAEIMGEMAYIDPGTLQITVIGDSPQAEYSPELTGTGKAEWFGYFPGSSTTFIAQLSKQDGQIEHQWPLPGLGSTVRAWAFAHWGGDFYVFVTTQSGGYNSQVLRLDPETGVTDTLATNLPYIIVGAGVSTCAPYQ